MLKFRHTQPQTLAKLSEMFFGLIYFIIISEQIIDGLAISKRAWAKAFYEKDIIQTSKVLFEALFSEQEMQQCTLNGKKGTPELSAIKMLAILSKAT